ncbi:hypothetical protein J6590_078655 [Homalodisca vitripennis]|nr:hypothetical protein J6590_078655 [Homalodisca vitripennis]
MCYNVLVTRGSRVTHHCRPAILVRLPASSRLSARPPSWSVYPPAVGSPRVIYTAAAALSYSVLAGYNVVVTRGGRVTHHSRAAILVRLPASSRLTAPAAALSYSVLAGYNVVVTRGGRVTHHSRAAILVRLPASSRLTARNIHSRSILFCPRCNVVVTRGSRVTHHCKPAILVRLPASSRLSARNIHSRSILFCPRWLQRGCDAWQ